MAEITFTCIVRDKNLENEWIIDSAGTAGYHIGDEPDERTIKVVKKHFGDKYPHDVDFRARQVSPKDFEKFDFIFCMDNSNLRDLKQVESKAKNPKAVLKMFGEYDPKGEKVIEDPYYGGMDGFEKNLQQVIRCSHAFLESLQK